MNSSKQERFNLLKNMFNSFNYNGKIFLLGFGAIGKPILYMLLKIVKMDPKNVTVIDKMNKNNENQYFRALGVNFIKCLITKDSYRHLLNNIAKNDIIIDCAYNIYTYDMLQLCQEKGCHYINSCIEFWDFEGVADPILYSLYYKQEELQKLNRSYPVKNFNAIISMGCNPGNVSIWTKLGLEKIAKKNNIPILGSFGELAKKIGVQVIHVSERDTQGTTTPKKVNEYCNTWASDGVSFCEEALGCIEASWGTHEKSVPEDKLLLKDNFIIINRMCIHTMAQSVVPLYGRYFGYVIRHDEANTIGKHLEVKEHDKIVYKPSVYYVYHPCDSARISMEEVIEREFEYQNKWRLLTDEINYGRDILGLTYFLENGDVYWIGSVLSIDEAREIFENKFNEWINATNVQVMAGYISGILHIMDLIKNKENKGLMVPDDLPHHKLWKYMKPFLGDFIFKKIDNFQLIKYAKSFSGKNSYTKDWQFDNFIVD
jgi:homospermidine synthase